MHACAAAHGYTVNWPEISWPDKGDVNKDLRNNPVTFEQNPNFWLRMLRIGISGTRHAATTKSQQCIYSIYQENCVAVVKLWGAQWQRKGLWLWLEQQWQFRSLTHKVCGLSLMRASHWRWHHGGSAWGLELSLLSATAISSVFPRRACTFSAGYFLNPDLVVRSNSSLRAMTHVIDCHCLQMSSNKQWARTPVRAFLGHRLVNERGDV